MNLQETKLPLFVKRRIHLIDKVIDNLLPNMYPCDYNSSDHFVEGVLDEIFYLLRDEPDLYGIDLISINDFILDYKYDELTNYFNEHCIVLKNDNLQESIKKILREEDYSPAGKEIKPNKIVVHKSNPMFRDKIMENGLKVRAGECYKIFVGYGVKCKPAIFATNSTNKRAWFDSTYDDDIWEINTEMIPDVKWYKDRHYESRSKHIVTFQDIPKEAITLKYEGTGSGDLEKWDKDSPNLYESIRRVLREDKKTKSTNKEFSKYKNSKFNTLRDYTLQDIVDNWDSLSDHKNENIKTIKHFINNPDKITDLVYDEKGLEDGYHRLIAAKILKKPRFTYRLVENLQESIRRVLREEITKDKNLYGENLKPCSTKPMTGFYRDGYCRTGDDDTGSHTVCAKVTEEFLKFTNSMGNNLDMLEPGDKWCLCAMRWKEAKDNGINLKVDKSATNIKTFNII